MRMRARIRSGLLVVGLLAGAVGCGPGGSPPDGDVVRSDGADVGTPDGTGEGGTCPGVDFVAPAANAVLGPSSDVDGSCANGFQYDVRVATNTPNGTQLELRVNGMVRATATVTVPQVVFAAVP